ncbi:uncharacterized protein RCC_10991 [Ramularia collo-cygni]|uniref:non-specific serine/threonine protein kinase n=1 Tax=Ramularia collo-cygni TaxID=112498 RepID=A0A2D3VIM2_9PEZI|nr:uncharacterized protein RCC_10991 [Ramularia collo-cygni]CZT25262.1 uncharacterized protein RCC_10991 [Ramularia collo-cygni]
MATAVDAYIDLEVRAWAHTKNGRMKGVHGIRTRSRNLWNRLLVAERNALTPTIDALRTALDNAGTPAFDVPPPPDVTDNNAVAAYSTAVTALSVARTEFIQAINNYLTLRAPYPKADFAEAWLDSLRIDQERNRTAEAAERARIVGGDRIASGTLSSRWTAVGPAGTGGNRKSIITYIKTVAGLVVDRVVVKDERDMFDFASVWDSATIIGRNLPTEITTMLRVRSRIGSQNIVKLRNWRVDDATAHESGRHQSFRIYLECCGFGTLTEVERPVPEPFIWKLFEDLVNACVILDRGDVDPGGASWDPIVHRDMKLDNIFLSDPGKSFCWYPTAKLGDFGPAMFVLPNDRRTVAQLSHVEVGTPQSRPPEQLNSTLAGSAGVWPMSTQSNVWGIGFLMWRLIQRRQAGCEREDETGFRDDRRTPDDFNDEARAEFSPDLLTLIMDCVQYLPINRPTLYDVQRRVRLGIEAHTQGLQNAAEDDAVWADDLLPIYADENENWAVTGIQTGGRQEDLGGSAGLIMTFPPLSSSSEDEG